MTFITVALPPSAHTYRLLFVKEPVLPAPLLLCASLSNRFVRQQQRNEIMKLLTVGVKRFCSSFLPTLVANCFFLQDFSVLQATSKLFDLLAAKRRDYDRLFRCRQPSDKSLTGRCQLNQPHTRQVIRDCESLARAFP